MAFRVTRCMSTARKLTDTTPRRRVAGHCVSLVSTGSSCRGPTQRRARPQSLSNASPLTYADSLYPGCDRSLSFNHWRVSLRDGPLNFDRIRERHECGEVSEGEFDGGCSASSGGLAKRPMYRLTSDGYPYAIQCQRTRVYEAASAILGPDADRFGV